MKKFNLKKRLNKMANIKMPDGRIVDSDTLESKSKALDNSKDILVDISSDIEQLQSFLNFWVLKGVGDNTLPILGTVYNTLTSMLNKIESPNTDDKQAKE